MSDKESDNDQDEYIIRLKSDKDTSSIKYDESFAPRIDDYPSVTTVQKPKHKSDFYDQKQFEDEVNKKARIVYKQKFREKKNASQTTNLVIDYHKMKNYKRVARVQQLASKNNSEMLRQKSANDLMSQINMDQMILGLESDRRLREDTQDAQASPRKTMLSNDQFISKF